MPLLNYVTNRFTISVLCHMLFFCIDLSKDIEPTNWHLWVFFVLEIYQMDFKYIVYYRLWLFCMLISINIIYLRCSFFSWLIITYWGINNYTMDLVCLRHFVARVGVLKSRFKWKDLADTSPKSNIPPTGKSMIGVIIPPPLTERVKK